MNKDYIAIADYKRYLLESSIPFWESRSKENRERYEQAKQRYESIWFVKLLRLKYEKSFMCEAAFWDFNEATIESRKLEVKRCEYHEKHQTTHIQSSFDIYDNFYKWCDENQIPY